MWRFPRDVLLLRQCQQYRYFSPCTRLSLAVRPEKRICIGLLREESNVWERRAPLAPHHIQTLVKNGMQVVVQPSTRRAYSMFEYTEAGATLEEDLSMADVILGVKGPTAEKLIANKTYAFFSHTIKAQEANMSLLDTCLEKHVRLVDYEKIVDSGRRAVAFGWYAGIAGMVNILHGLGLRLLALGHHTPFMHLGGAHNYPSSSAAKAAIASIGREIQYGLMPECLGPLVFVCTGSGNVSQGAQNVLRQLPVQMISPSELPDVVKNGDHRRVYATIVRRKDYLERINGGGFDVDEFEKFPERYHSTFANKVAPYMTVLINGVFWQPGLPRLLTVTDSKALLQKRSYAHPTVGVPNLPHRLLAIADISADPNGSIEFMRECTSLDNLFVMYNPDNDSTTMGNFAGDGVLMMSVDNLPAQFPREATDFFGDQLRLCVPELAKVDWNQSSFTDVQLQDPVKNAVITFGGRLTPNFEYISELRIERSEMKEQQLGVGHAVQRRVVLFGSGFVARPLLEELTKINDVAVHVASAIPVQAEQLIQGLPRCTFEQVNATDADNVSRIVKGNDLIISVLPAPLHPHIAKACLSHGINFLTASYTSPEMQAFDEAARDRGLCFLNEVGLDPGIDHFLAMECIDDVNERGGQIESFVSWCGGLPAPEDSDNPLRYKFSWSPYAVLTNVLRPAAFWENGQNVEVPEGGSLLSAAEKMNFMPGFALEGIPNRDSRRYRVPYGIESAHTVKRGTLRYLGYVNAMKGLLKIGLINSEPHPRLQHDAAPLQWRDLMAMLVAQTDVRESNLRSSVLKVVDGDEDRLRAIEDLGLLSEDPVSLKGSPVSALCDKLAGMLVYGPGERDIVILRHSFGINWPEGGTSRSQETRNISLVLYGKKNGHSAMAMTVGMTTAFAAKLMLSGGVQRQGVICPFTSDIYAPILKDLERAGIASVTKSRWT